MTNHQTSQSFKPTSFYQLFSFSSGSPGLYAGLVGEYAGLVGEYAGLVGEYAGLVGE